LPDPGLINTGSELQRRKWKQQPENAGHLFTGGLFRYAMQINYFGDELLFTGYALIRGSMWALLVPVVMPGVEFEDYAQQTRRFAPFVY
jgi:steroid 5-alpha reductase family enzyme